MSEQPSGPAGPGSDEWPDDLWPDDDNSGVSGDPWAPSVPPGGPGGMPGPGTGAGPGGGPARRRFSPITLAAIAVVAVVAGAAIALGLQLFGSPAASAPSSQPSALSPLQPGAGAQPGSGGQAGPNGGFPGGGGVGQAFLIAKVLKVSPTSITLGGPGRSITASVTSSTRITGKVSAISGIKVGDQVSAQITEGNGGPTVTAIQDPAQSPAGGIPGG